jgi:hypothetical protein
MCVVSMVGDHYNDKWRDRWPDIWPKPDRSSDPEDTKRKVEKILEQIHKSELDKLREEVKELKKLWDSARKYDEANGESECQLEEKVALIKALAKALGVDMSDLVPTIVLK